MMAQETRYPPLTSSVMMAYNLQHQQSILTITAIQYCLSCLVETHNCIICFTYILFIIVYQQVYQMNSSEDALTAKAWVLLENRNKKYWRGSNTMNKLEMASLTKMYTLTAALLINQELNIHPQNLYIQIVPSTKVGTLAKLQVGRYLKLSDLYYGLMLPSGNDAALVLSYYYGYWLGNSERVPGYQWQKDKIESLEGKRKYHRIYLSRFINYMNEYVVKKFLKQQDTHFENPHGLPDKLQKSTAWQIGHATIQFLKNSKFQKIVQTQHYTSVYYNEKLDGMEQLYWENTNILLDSAYNYVGVKTGHTKSAGNCLASRKLLYHKGKVYDLVLILLGADKLEARFTETLQIIDDFKRYLGQNLF